MEIPEEIPTETPLAMPVEIPAGMPLEIPMQICMVNRTGISLGIPMAVLSFEISMGTLTGILLENPTEIPTGILMVIPVEIPVGMPLEMPVEIIVETRAEIPRWLPFAILEDIPTGAHMGRFLVLLTFPWRRARLPTRANRWRPPRDLGT